MSTTPLYSRKSRSTKAPVPTFHVFDLRISLIPLQKSRRQQIVQKQHPPGRGDPRARRGAPDTLRGGNRVIALIDGDQAARHPEDTALDQSLADIPDIDARTHLRPEAPGIDVHD